MSRSFWSHLAVWRHLWRMLLGSVLLLGAAALGATMLLLCPSRILPPPAQVQGIGVVIGAPLTATVQVDGKPGLSATATVAPAKLTDGRVGLLQVPEGATYGSHVHYWMRRDTHAVSATMFGPRHTPDKPALALLLGLPALVLFLIGGGFVVTTLINISGERVREEQVNARLARLRLQTGGRHAVPGLPQFCNYLLRDAETRAKLGHQARQRQDLLRPRRHVAKNHCLFADFFLTNNYGKRYPQLVGPR
jgi:hypothetical protein